MATFDQFTQALDAALKELVARTLDDVKDAATKDGDRYLKKCKADLEKWTVQLAKNELSAADFAFCLRSETDLGAMIALERAGLTAIRLSRFRDDLVQTVVHTAATVFLG
jgi:hypothetical protein